MVGFPEHPDVASALVAGYPSRVSCENRDSAEYRYKFAKENIAELIAFALAGDPDILKGFAEEHANEFLTFA